MNMLLDSSLMNAVWRMYGHAHLKHSGVRRLIAPQLSVLQYYVNAYISINSAPKQDRGSLAEEYRGRDLHRLSEAVLDIKEKLSVIVDKEKEYISYSPSAEAYESDAEPFELALYLVMDFINDKAVAALFQ